MNTFLFPRYRNRMLIFFICKIVQILKTEYKYGQYCTPLSRSDCRYFFVLAIILFIKLILSYQTNSFNLNCIFLKEKIVLIGDYNVTVHYNYRFFFQLFERYLRRETLNENGYFFPELKRKIPLGLY